MEERIVGRGHEHVSGTHTSTFEVTTDDWLTPAGDCILAIGADRAPADFDPAFVEECQSAEARITATITVDSHETVISGRGHPDLTFDSPRSAVGRTSHYTDDRTVMVGADAAAADLDRGLVEELSANAEFELVLEVE